MGGTTQKGDYHDDYYSDVQTGWKHHHLGLEYSGRSKE